jgi:hypothetical protein
MLHTVDLTKLEKNLKMFADTNILNLINENQLKSLFGNFSLLSLYLIDSFKFNHAKTIAFLKNNSSMINRNSIILKFKILAEKNLKFLKNNLETIKPLFEDKKFFDESLKELFEFDFSSNYDDTLIKKYPNIEESIEEELRIIKEKKKESCDLMKSWESECEKLIVKKKYLNEEIFKKKCEEYHQQLSSYNNTIQSHQSEIDKLIRELHHERLFNNNSEDQLDIFLKLKEVNKVHENFKLDIWNELFPSENFQENKFVVENKSPYYCTISYQIKYKEGNFSKEESIGNGEFYLSDFTSDIKTVTGINIIVYSYYLYSYYLYRKM